jgi:hypothetical protein
MPYSSYIRLQDEDKIVTFDVNTDTGRLARSETSVAGGPSVLAISADRRELSRGISASPARRDKNSRRV